MSFRWSDGDWIARVRLVVRNASDQPIVVPRVAFVAEGWRPWDNVSASRVELIPVAPPTGQESEH